MPHVVGLRTRCAEFASEVLVLLNRGGGGGERRGEGGHSRFCVIARYTPVMLTRGRWPDRFIIVGHGEQDARIPGNTVAISSTKPYQGLLSFGQGFLSRFEEVSCNHELLEVGLSGPPAISPGKPSDRKWPDVVG